MKSRFLLYAALACAVAAPAAAAPSFEASLTDADAKAKKGEATVQVKVTGVQLIDPAAVQEKPRDGQGHLHYRVDGGPVIATPSAKLSFHELAQGDHRIEVTLAGNDHKPLMPSKTLRVTVPADVSAQR
jgi:hypothetical protein